MGIMNRFFTEPGNIKGDSIIIDNKQDIRHISKVLRLGRGDEIQVSDAAKWEYIGEITDISKDMVILKIVDRQKNATEPDVQVTLFQALPKQSKMELIIQKTVELGIYEIVPMFTARTVVTDNGKMDGKLTRWQRISDEAVKQCKRGYIPEIKPAINFKEMIERLKEFDLVLFPYENEENRTLKSALRELKDKPKKIAIIIGSEGGFSDEEADKLKSEGADCVTLGKTTLRTETAGMASLAMVMYELEL